MADQNIALGVQVPEAFKSISGLLNFAGQAQQLRNSQQDYQRGAVALEKETKTLPAAIAKFQAESEQARTGADRASLELQTRNQDIARNTVSALATNPAFIQGDSATRHHILDYTEKYLNAQGLGSTPGGAVDQTRKLIDANAKPDDLLGHIRGFIQQAQTPEARAAMVNHPVDLVKNGAGNIPVQLQPNAPGGLQPGGPAIPNQVAPAQQEVIETDAQGNRFIVTRAPSGAIVNSRQVPVGAAAPGPNGQPGPQPVFAMPPGDREAIPVLEAERTNARNALSSAPIAHTTNRGIMDEIDKVSTGTVGPTLQKIASTLGVSFNSAEQRASAYDLVGKYLERNAIEAAKAMGPNTNAGLEAAVKANGSTAYNPTAIKTLTKLNDAIVSGAELYQPALEKAIAANPQRGVLAKREFDQAWGQNFDPRIMQLESAVANGDQAEVAAIRKSLGEKGTQELLRKAQNLRKLSTDGRL